MAALSLLNMYPFILNIRAQDTDLHTWLTTLFPERSTLKGKNLLIEQILSFKSGPGKIKNGLDKKDTLMCLSIGPPKNN